MVHTLRVSKEKLSMEKVILKRSNSLPEIQHGETLLEEMGIDEEVRRDVLEEHELNRLKKELEAKSKVCITISGPTL